MGLPTWADWHPQVPTACECRGHRAAEQGHAETIWQLGDPIELGLVNQAGNASRTRAMTKARMARALAISATTLLIASGAALAANGLPGSHPGSASGAVLEAAPAHDLTVTDRSELPSTLVSHQPDHATPQPTGTGHDAGDLGVTDQHDGTTENHDATTETHHSDATHESEPSHDSDAEHDGHDGCDDGGGGD